MSDERERLAKLCEDEAHRGIQNRNHPGFSEDYARRRDFRAIASILRAAPPSSGEVERPMDFTAMEKLRDADEWETYKWPQVEMRWSSEEGGYWLARLRDFDGVMGDGATREEAFADVPSAAVSLIQSQAVWLEEALRSPSAAVKEE